MRCAKSSLLIAYSLSFFQRYRAHRRRYWTIEDRLSEIDQEVTALKEQAKGLLKERIKIYSVYDCVSLALDRKLKRLNVLRHGLRS